MKEPEKKEKEKDKKKVEKTAGKEETFERELRPCQDRQAAKEPGHPAGSRPDG